MQWFDFGLPFGWEELSAVATAVAVIVALWANRKTTLQMRDTLRAQEQSKNLELFEKRVQIMHCVENDEPFSDLEMKLLFPQEVSSVCAELRTMQKERERYEEDLKKYKFMLVYDSALKNEDSPIEELEYLKSVNDMPVHPEKASELYVKRCKETEITVPGDSSEEKRVLNYNEITSGIENCTCRIEEHKTVLVSKMSEYVQKSIAPLDTKEE